jgi:hypothetical protein
MLRKKNVGDTYTKNYLVLNSARVFSVVFEKPIAKLIFLKK